MSTTGPCKGRSQLNWRMLPAWIFIIFWTSHQNTWHTRGPKWHSKPDVTQVKWYCSDISRMASMDIIPLTGFPHFAACGSRYHWHSPSRSSCSEMCPPALSVTSGLSQADSDRPDDGEWTSLPRPAMWVTILSPPLCFPCDIQTYPLYRPTGFSHSCHLHCLLSRFPNSFLTPLQHHISLLSNANTPHWGALIDAFSLALETCWVSCTCSSVGFYNLHPTIKCAPSPLQTSGEPLPSICPSPMHPVMFYSQNNLKKKEKARDKGTRINL